MSEIDVDFHTETFELDDEASEFGFEWDGDGDERSVTINVDTLVGTMESTVTVTPDDPEDDGGEEQTQTCWKFNDEETEHGVTLPIDADFEVSTHLDFIQVNFNEEDVVESTKYFDHLENHTYDSGTYATSMRLVER